MSRNIEKFMKKFPLNNGTCVICANCGIGRTKMGKNRWLVYGFIIAMVYFEVEQRCQGDCKKQKIRYLWKED